MNNGQQHIDRIIRDKFSNFNPSPPNAIWENIETELDSTSTPGFFSKTNPILYFAVAAILILLLGWLLLGSKTILHKKVAVKEMPVLLPDYSMAQRGTNMSPTKNYPQKLQSNINRTVTDNITKKNKITLSTQNQKKNLKGSTSNLTSVPFHYTASTEIAHSVIAQMGKHNKSIPTLGALLLSDNGFPSALPQLISPLKMNFKSTIEASSPTTLSRWQTGILISPEFTLSSPDSLRILQSYTLGIDMQYSINHNLFIRFGMGTTYARDRGFTNLIFNSWDYLGSYNDVYDVTFDTTSGTPVPIYHTHKVDVYDSIRHIDVSETTNQYLYLQFPLLIGYNGKTSGRWAWYLYGGPAINTMVFERSTSPQLAKGSTLIKIETNLIQRNKTVYQFWLGAGFSYAINNKYRFVLEPNYRYYFNPVLKNYYKNQSLSALSLRFGLLIKM